VEDGTVNDTEKDPLLLVVVVGIVIGVESYVSDMAELAAKPTPVTVTEVPTVPLIGLILMVMRRD